MAVKLERLSSNLVEFIEKCVNDEELSKLLYYNGINPLSQPAVNPSDIAPFGKKERVLPYPFDVTFTDEERSQLHIYYPEMSFKNNEHVEESFVWFDIVVHKNLWLFSQNSKRLVRPYKIASCIGRLFDDTMPQVEGERLHFGKMAHIPVNAEYNCIRIEAKMVTF